MSETTYTIENAKSGRSACKKCKTKIEKGELRIGTHAPGPGDYSMSSWRKVECFTLPRKLAKEGVTVHEFVKEYLMDETNDKNLFEIEDKIVQAIENKPNASSKSTKKEAEGSKIDKIKKDLEKIRKTDDEGEEAKPKKKVKRESNGTQDNFESLSGVDTDIAKVFEIYENFTNDELKDVLRWNRQLISGKKDILLQRIIDGHMNGRLGMCPSCSEGKLKLRDDGEEVFCNGYFDEDSMTRIPCFYTCKREEATRYKPWFTEKPTDEENKEIDAMMGKKDSKSAIGGDSKLLLEFSSNAEKLEEEGKWNLASATDLKASTKAMVNLCAGTLDIPSDTKKATMEIGKLLLLNRSISATEFAKVLADKFGFVGKNKEAQKQRAKTVAAACKHEGNGPLMMAMLELSDLYYKEKNTNAGTTYKKVAGAIQNLKFEVTSDNAKGLGKGKTKVDGIGKGSADKMYEFVTTGKMEKLEEKRASQ